MESQPAEALPHFQHAYELRPNPVVLLRIADCQERAARIPDAIATLEHYLHDRPDAPDHATVQARIADLRRRPSTLHVASTPAGARVLLDAHDTGQTTPADVSAPAGHHTVGVELAGHDAFHQDVDAEPGSRAEITATLATSAPAVPTEGAQHTAAGPTAAEHHEAAHHGVNPVVWLSAGLAVAGVASGTVFGLLALGEQQDYDRAPTADIRSRGETYAVVADVSFAAAVLATAVAIIVAVADRTPEEPAGGERAQRRRNSNGVGVAVAPNGLTLRF
jgi:hypothetical protein